MGMCIRCGTETGGAKFCPECGLPQSMQPGAGASAEPGAFVPLTIGKKSKAKRSAEKKADPPKPPKQPKQPKPPKPPKTPKQGGGSKAGVVLVAALCLISALAIVFAIVALRGYAGQDAPPSSQGSSAPSAQQARSSSRSATAREVARAKIASPEEKARVQDAIADAAAIPAADYTAESYAALSEAISLARTTASDEAATSSEARNAVKRIEAAASSLEEKVKPVAFTGTGSSVLAVPAELARSMVSASYTGAGPFSVSTLGDDGNAIDVLVDAEGPYTGVTAAGKALGEPKMISIVADGDWSITLSSMSDAPAVASGQQVIGDAVVSIDPKRAASLAFANTGEGNFVVYGIKGASSNLIVNEIGSFSGEVPNAGYRMLAVKSNGTWSVSW